MQRTSVLWNNDRWDVQTNANLPTVFLITPHTRIPRHLCSSALRYRKMSGYFRGSTSLLTNDHQLLGCAIIDHYCYAGIKCDPSWWAVIAMWATVSVVDTLCHATAKIWDDAKRLSYVEYRMRLYPYMFLDAFWYHFPTMEALNFYLRVILGGPPAKHSQGYLRAPEIDKDVHVHALVNRLDPSRTSKGAANVESILSGYLMFPSSYYSYPHKSAGIQVWITVLLI